MDPKNTTTDPVVPKTETTTTTTTATQKTAEELAAELAQAQHTIIKLKKEKGEPIDIETVKAEIAEANRVELEKFKADQTKEIFEEVLASMASTPEDREAIRKEYETGIQKSGFTRSAFRADLEKARLLANKPRIEKTIGELRQTAISKNTQSGASTTGQEIGNADVVLTDSEESQIRAIATRRGLKIEDVRKKYIANKQG